MQFKAVTPRKNDKGDRIKDIQSWLSKVKTIFTRIAFLIQYYTKKLLFQIKRRAPVLKKLHLESFPAIHLKRMDWMDFMLKFSSELLVLVLSLMVAGLNLFFFSGGNFRDQSLAGDFLIKHPGQNSKLYAKNTSITTVLGTSSFLPQAQAEDFTGLDALGLPTIDPNSDGNSIVMGDEDSILAPNPDNVHSLIAKQVKIYNTQAGDTLQSIAQNFGISTQTILWANPKLTSSTIKAGWQLIILPTDGVLVTATDNDTLPDIARKYGVPMETIISYNALASAEDINGGDLIIVPGGTMPEPPKPKPTPKPTTPKKPVVPKDTSKIGGAGPIEDVTPEPDIVDDGTGHTFPKGYCTWYVAQRLGSKVQLGGNAKAWIANSKAYGAVVDRDPAPGTILVTNESRKYGHVAYVEEVTETSVIVTEMNYEKFGKVDRREIPLNSSVIKGFIHP